VQDYDNKNQTKNSSSTQRHFTEHLAGVFRKTPHKNN
jgi:hypothetical protein